jgi:putative ABC transport system permease protein
LFVLIQLEVLLVTLLSMLSAAGLLLLSLYLLQDTLAADFGLFISLNIVKLTTLYWAGGILLLSALLATLPGILAYRKALADGLTVRL